MFLYTVRQKSNPLGKSLYLWNCSRLFYQSYSIYRGGFSQPQPVNFIKITDVVQQIQQFNF